MSTHRLDSFMRRLGNVSARTVRQDGHDNCVLKILRGQLFSTKLTYHFHALFVLLFAFDVELSTR